MCSADGRAIDSPAIGYSARVILESTISVHQSVSLADVDRRGSGSVLSNTPVYVVSIIKCRCSVESSGSWLGFVRGESLSVEVHGLVLRSVIDAM